MARSLHLHKAIPGSELYSFCESVTASSRSPWHIRKLDETGRHTGGGITTPSLCGLVKPRGAAHGALGGWDLDEKVVITAHHGGHCCTKCWEKFNAEIEAAKAT